MTVSGCYFRYLFVYVTQHDALCSEMQLDKLPEHIVNAKTTAATMVSKADRIECFQNSFNDASYCFLHLLFYQHNFVFVIR